MKNLRRTASLNLNEEQEGRHHEVLFRQLQLLAVEKQNLKHKLDDWEVAYHTLREIEDSLLQAYRSL